MITHFRTISLAACALLVLLSLTVGAVERSAERLNSRARVEAAWFEQDRLQDISKMWRIPITTRVDAQGGCDGVKGQEFGFHTEKEEQPWWSVDLGQKRSFNRVVIYNRCDREDLVKLARDLYISVSNDGQTWREVYRHDGSVFYGAKKMKPLRVALGDITARHVRVQLPGKNYLHLDEIEVYNTQEPTKNLALGCPADQSSTSGRSTRSNYVAPDSRIVYPIEEALTRGHQLVEALRDLAGNVTASQAALNSAEAEWKSFTKATPNENERALYLKIRWTLRELTLSNPLLDFDDLLFVKRIPGHYSHMSDQYYGWWSKPGGGVYILKDIKSPDPREICLTGSLPPGSFLRPDIAPDGKRILFAYSRYYSHVTDMKDKVAKETIPEDAFYHVYEMNVDGTGLRKLTHGRYDDFDARYLPNGEIVFLSTRRGQFVQCTKETARETTEATLPDSYVRCGGGNWRPVAVYTLHVIDPDGTNLRAISPFENFEWTPSVAGDGRILFARWDYVDRDNMPFMSLWSCNPDGTNVQAVYGNFTRSPHCIFEARSIPDSNKMIFTASGHHSINGGSLVLLDPSRGIDDEEPLTRLTPEVGFPEVETWPTTYYANPFPLSETFYLTAWSNLPLLREGSSNPPNSLGLYVYDTFGNLEPIYRDPSISSMYPIPVRTRKNPPIVVDKAAWDGEQTGEVLLVDVYEGLKGVERGAVKNLRLVGVPAKTQPHMNTPRLGVTRDDPGKFVLGTVPVEDDGSAYFTVPSGVGFFLQALDEEGCAVQTMRTLTYLQPDQSVSCIGCHESRENAPPRTRPSAASRPPSNIALGPEGSFPLRFDTLVQPVLDKNCVGCHSKGSAAKAAAKFALTPEAAYDNLMSFGKPSLRDHVLDRYYGGKSLINVCVAKNSQLLDHIGNGHKDVQLTRDELDRLITWMDVYAQERGSFSDDQERRIERLKTRMIGLARK